MVKYEWRGRKKKQSDLKTYISWEKMGDFLVSHVTLVGGWTNPFEKYARQIGDHLPQF